MIFVILFIVFILSCNVVSHTMKSILFSLSKQYFPEVARFVSETRDIGIFFRPNIKFLWSLYGAPRTMYAFKVIYEHLVVPSFLIYLILIRFINAYSPVAIDRVIIYDCRFRSRLFVVSLFGGVPPVRAINRIT